jgi:hypothetical protein
VISLQDGGIRADGQAVMSAGMIFCLVLVAVFAVWVMGPEFDWER